MSSSLPSVLMVSKPVAPPWNDSSKNLVRDLAVTGDRFAYHVLTPRGFRLETEGRTVISEPLYPGRRAFRFTPPLAQNARVLLRLLRRDSAALTHFFFAPNPRACQMARVALRLRPRRTVQTVCSAPSSYERADELLFADRVVVLSRHTHRCFVAAGIAPDRLRVIPPGIQIPPLPDPAARLHHRRRHDLPLDRPVVIYPGDYQFSGAAETFCQAILEHTAPAATFVFACRIKQPASLEVERRIRSALAAAGRLEQVRMLQEVDDMPGLLAACDLCVLPAESLYAKMDLPLVLLEAMALGVPLVVADRPPLCEVVHRAGVTVPPQNPGLLARAIADLLAQPTRLREMGEAARAAALADYDIRGVSAQYEQLYEEVLRR